MWRVYVRVNGKFHKADEVSDLTVALTVAQSWLAQGKAVKIAPVKA